MAGPSRDNLKRAGSRQAKLPAGSPSPFAPEEILAAWARAVAPTSDAIINLDSYPLKQTQAFFTALSNLPIPMSVHFNLLDCRVSFARQHDPEMKLEKFLECMTSRAMVVCCLRRAMTEKQTPMIEIGARNVYLPGESIAGGGVERFVFFETEMTPENSAAVASAFELSYGRSLQGVYEARIAELLKR